MEHSKPVIWKRCVCSSGAHIYTAEGSMFEGLFLRALHVDAGSEFASDLLGVGFDVSKPRANYDISVWVACVDVAWRHVHPEQSRDEAWRRLGRQFIEGYFQTAIGAVIAATLPLMSPARFIERAPWFLRTGLGGSGCEVDFVGERRAVLTLRGPHARSAILLAGVVEVCFEKLGGRVECSPRELAADDSVLEVSWGGLA